MKRNTDDTVKFCEFCRFATNIAKTEDMLCEHRGVVDKEYVCRKFIYDPLKRIPRRPPELVVPDELAEED